MEKEGEKYKQYLVAMNRIADALAGTKIQEQIDDDKRAFREIVTIVLLICTVVFTGAADVIFYYTMKDAREAAVTQHIDTGNALDKAAEANRNAKDTAERQLRAYVFVNSANLQTNGVIWDLKNSGQTPAYRITSRSGLSLREYPLKNSITGPPATNRSVYSCAGESYHGYFDNIPGMTEADKLAVKERRGAIYLFGEIDYVDIFNVGWCVKFRLIYYGDVNDNPAKAFAPADSGNEEKKCDLPPNQSG